MEYTLILKSGKIMTFYLRATADCFQNIYGGTLVWNTKIESADTPCYN